MTMSLSLLDVDNSRVTFCSAGHPRCSSAGPTAASRSWATTSRASRWGSRPDWEYKQLEVDIHPGDVLVIYSDGVTDARSPAEELYDSKRAAAG